MTTLYFIRHGQASFGQRNYDRLSALGEQQARITGAHLQHIGVRPDAMLAGEMHRQQNSARQAASCMDSPPALQTHAAFDEYDAGGMLRAYVPQVMAEDPELAAQRARLTTDPKVFQRVLARASRKWLADAAHDARRFESWQAFKQRVCQGLRSLHADYDRDATLAVFTSGGPIAVAVGAALGLTDDATIQVNWSVYNSSFTVLRSNKTGWRLMGFNNISHLQLQNDPALITHR